MTLTETVTSASRAKDRWAGGRSEYPAQPSTVDCRLVALGDADYPKALRAADAPPSHLYVIGPLNQPGDERAVAIVGSRAPSHEGVRAATSLAGDLAGRGHTIVSGLAAGIDAAAHQGALDANGRTIAVMGTGIDRTHPLSNTSLRNQIAKRGTIVSQFATGHPPSKTTFPARNVLIAGLSRVSVLIELSERSGTRIEATVALEQCKPVLLWAPLLAHLKWAQEFASHPLVEFASSADDIEIAVARLA